MHDVCKQEAFKSVQNSVFIVVIRFFVCAHAVRRPVRIISFGDRLTTDDHARLLTLLGNPDEKMTTLNFEQYRKPFELDDYWELKKEFLEKYHDEFELDRLLALAQIFINIEVLGNTYDESIMALIRRLTEDWESLRLVWSISAS